MEIPAISALLSSLGFPANGFVPRSDLLPPDQSAFVVLFPYLLPHEEVPPFQPSGNQLHIASFAAANHYAAMVRLLKMAVHSLGQSAGLARSAFRIAVNSSLQEKKLALEAGLGFIGRSSLLISPLYGAACLIGVLVLPAAAVNPAAEPRPQPEASQQDSQAAAPDTSGCRDCCACAAACPSAAIDADARPGFGYLRESCLQHWTAAQTIPPAIAAVRGQRLYGCDACILVCPYTRRRNPQLARSAALLLSADERQPGRSLDPEFLLETSAQNLKTCLKGSCMGRSWLPPEAFIAWTRQWMQIPK